MKLYPRFFQVPNDRIQNPVHFNEFRGSHGIRSLQFQINISKDPKKKKLLEFAHTGFFYAHSIIPTTKKTFSEFKL